MAGRILVSQPRIKLTPPLQQKHSLNHWTIRVQCTHAKSLQSCPILCNLMDCSPPGSSVHGILQARILEWVAMPSSRRSSRHRGQLWVSYISCTGRWVLHQKSPDPLFNSQFHALPTVFLGLIPGPKALAGPRIQLPKLLPWSCFIPVIPVHLTSLQVSELPMHPPFLPNKSRNI